MWKPNDKAMGGKGSGGAREGAGRKSIDGAPRGRVTLCLPVDLINRLKEEADRRNLSFSQLLTFKLST